MTEALPMSAIPGPAFPPVLGWRGFTYQFARDSVKMLHHLNDTYGSIVKAGEGKMSAIFTFHPEYTRKILSNPALFYSFGLEDIPFPFVNIEALRSLTTAISLINGDLHKRHRRMMTPAFNHSLLPIYVEQIEGIVEKYFKSWKYGDVVDIYQAMDLFTLSVSMEIFVGMASDQEGRKFANLFEEVLNLLFSPKTFLAPYDIPGLPYHRLKIKGTELEKQLKDLISRRREKGLEGTDSLSIFLRTQDEDGSTLTDNEVIGETVAVFRGGSKTSASVLTWTLFLISQHPKVYADLMDELRSVLGGSAPTLEQLGSLPLLEGVVKESLRLIPPVVWGVRYSVDSFEMGGYAVEKGQPIIYSSHVTHRMPDIYTNPNQFDPYRWQSIKPSPYEYFPFSAGPRRCLGGDFAMMELRITIAVLLQRFSFEFLPNQSIDRVGLTGSLPKHGIKMRLGQPNVIPQKVQPLGNIHQVLDLK